MRQSKINRILSTLLALALCLQLLPPVPAAAEELTEEQTAESTVVAAGETVTGTAVETTAETTQETTRETSETTVSETTGETTEPTASETTQETTEPTVSETTQETTEPTVPEATGDTGEPALFSDDIWQTVQTGNKVGESEYIFASGVSYNGRNSLELLEELLKEYTQEVVFSNDVLISMPLEKGEQLILLSVTDPRVYQNTVFEAGSGSTGASIGLSGELGNEELKITFQGLGSASAPFRGSFEGVVSFAAGHTLFNYLDYTQAVFLNDRITVQQSGSGSGTMIASTILSTQGKSLTVDINPGGGNISGAVFGEISGSLNLRVSFSNSNNTGIIKNTSASHAGMIANTVSGGALTLSIDTFPGEPAESDAIQIGASGDSCHAGLLVGCLENADLILNAMTFPKSQIQSVAGGAGVLAGKMTNANITLQGDINFAKTKLLGKSSGGIAGWAENISFSFGNFSFQFSDETNKAKIGGNEGGFLNIATKSNETGGIFGKYTCNGNPYYTTYDGTGFSFPGTLTLSAATENDGYAGALFGQLNLKGTCFSVAPADSGEPLAVNCEVTVAAGSVDVGGLAGQVTGTGKADTLKVSNTNATIKTTGKPRYYGGLVGNVYNASARADGITVNTGSQDVTAACGFGGIVGLLGDGCVLNTENGVTISTDGSISSGGGLVGFAKTASAVRLNGVTDLSGAVYSANANVGQLVGKQDSALIFATGSGNDGSWTYHRSSAAVRVDDIGNYGQVIRLGGNLSSGLIQVDNDTNEVSFLAGYSPYGTIASANDFALHAIAFTTKDAFGLYPGVSVSTSDVTLNSSIDLSGTGIQGLTRDNNVDISFTFNGKNGGITFDGNGKTLTINTGEPYGLRGGTPVTADDTGAGQCYRHGYYGLLGKVNSAIVKDLNIKTTMNIGVEENTYAGAVIGYVDGGYSGEGAVNTVENVTVQTGSGITVYSYASSRVGHIGGIIGSATGIQTGVAVNNCQSYANLKSTPSAEGIVLGGILGKDSYATKVDLTFSGVTVGGSITNNTTSNAHVGGLVGDIAPKDKDQRVAGRAKMDLQNITVTAAMETKAGAGGTSGGFLGYYWDNVEVTFDGSSATSAVSVSGASLKTSGSAAGGLCYAATGKWDMKGNAVALKNVSISNGNGDLGLLVCHGERQNENPGSYSQGNNAMALYLVMDTAWGTAYSMDAVSVGGSHNVFDEIVAYTARSKDITLNDAGIISLRTTGNTVVMDGNGTRNTYENRVLPQKTNPYSRYYYNLDTLAADANDGVSSPAELVLWSVYQYCAENIRGYLPARITDRKITGTLNMKGYSYYPVTVINTNVDIDGAVITFYNQQIEALETNTPNKSTLASGTSDRTQHFTMHSGLLYDYSTDGNSADIVALTVNNTTMLGTVGMVEDGSGALICGATQRGADSKHSVRLEINDLNLDGQVPLGVNNFAPEYAPLLINCVGSYTTLEMAGVKARDTAPGATSLIGRVDGTYMNLSFSLMELADETDNSRFTKATMLHSFHFQEETNSAVYNFTREQDWENGEHVHHVTYGKEIGGTLEYIASNNPKQEKYFQSTDYVSHTGNAFGESDTRDSFDSYLPYVYISYDADGMYHEIQVNGSLTNVAAGCGTYADPYQISSVEELQSIATYLALGTPSKGWELNIPASGTKGESSFCSPDSNTHTTYVYNGSQWERKPLGTAEALSVTPNTLTNDTVRRYLCNAYYQITQDLTVSGFMGIGTLDYPFRGVIVGDGRKTITLTGTLPKGFIVASCGSVVKGLNLAFTGSGTIQFAGIKGDYTMENYFGGVIGNILGGDNIIESVNVTYTGGAKVALGTEKPYLIPVGGYVGLIQGGGVIFRGTNTLTGVPSDLVTNGNYFYVNAYVGRVLQGFAVNEGTSGLDNSDKNYQICGIDRENTNGIQLSSANIALSDAQALLIFSSVTGSGGAGGGALCAYLSDAKTGWSNGSFGKDAAMGGKVRNAAYANVGNAAKTDSDYQLSLKDDFTAFGNGNTSYLDTHYAGGNLYNVCADTPYSLTFSGGTYDMTDYGNGYRSISPRYLSTAVCRNDGSVYYKGLNPLISGVSGMGENGDSQTRIHTSITVREYVDDEYHAIAVGGLFNTIRLTDKATTLENITIGGSSGRKAIISHEYWEWLGNGKAWNDSTHKNWGRNVKGFTNLGYGQGRGLVAVGGFAGNTAMEVSNTSVTFHTVNTQYLDIKGPFDAGGILGHTGVRVASSDKFTLDTTEQRYRICQLINAGDAEIVPSFHNCTFQSLNVDGGWMVGGYIGVTANGVFAPPAGKNSSSNVMKITFDDDRWLGRDSRIICRRPKTDDGIDSAKGINNAIQKCLPAAGGLIGCSRYGIHINNTGRASLENVEVRSSRSAGGVIGWPFHSVTIKNVDVIGTSPENKTQIGDLRTYPYTTSGDTSPCCEFAGGVIGYFESVGTLTVTDCKVENLLVVASFRSPNGASSTYPCYAAGIVGDLNAGATNHLLANCQAKNLQLATDNMSVTEAAYTGRTINNGFEGGLVGRVAANGGLYGANLLLDNIGFSVWEGKENSEPVGHLIGGLGGATTGGRGNYVFLAGVSIQHLKPWAGSARVKDIGGKTSASQSYVAYADYWDTAQMTAADAVPDPNTPEQYLDEVNAGAYLQGNETVISIAAQPYVTTSPRGVAIPIGPADGSGTKPVLTLYGDGANPGIVNRIWQDTKDKSPGRFYHDAPKGYEGNPLDSAYDLGKYCKSSFYQEMGLTEETANGIPDFPVLMVPLLEEFAPVTNEIEGYLNLITNNAYYTARYTLPSLDSVRTYVTVTIEQYSMTDDGYFTVSGDSAVNASVLKNEGNTFQTVGYDTGKNQFEMLTVTFTERGYSYIIRVPIVVRRMLEIDFTATLKDSPSFREEDYGRYGPDGFNPNTAVGYGVTVSALLQYHYNRAIGEEQSYNWEYLLNNGGFLGDPGQTIRFNNPRSGLKSLPKDTQLILVDCADGNKAYRYKVTEQSTTQGSYIPLSSFIDSHGVPYSRWLSEIIGATVEENAEGKWVRTDNEADATARVNGSYYRHWDGSGDAGSGERYDLKVGNEHPEQKFYLVIYIPESSTGGIPESSSGEGRNLNGYISTSLDALTTNHGIQTNINPVRWDNNNQKVVKDPWLSSESTYNFLSGYAQSLKDLSEDKDLDAEHYVLLDKTEADGSYVLHMDFADEITVVKEQKDGEGNLYFKADVSLPRFTKNANDSMKLESANGFPTGCNGTAEFYVYTVDEAGNPLNYYKWTENGWETVGSREAALSYEWASDGKNMELYLGTQNSKEDAVSLGNILFAAKQIPSQKFVVEMKMDIHMSVLAAQQVIAGSLSGKGGAYTKLSCTNYLASDKKDFSSTNYVNSGMGEVCYYQNRSGKSTLTHSANDPTQLGINCSDLVSAGGLIYTTGVYDLNTLSNAGNLLEDADRVTYILTLWQRSDSGYVQVTQNLGKYLRSVQMNDEPVDVGADGSYRLIDSRTGEGTDFATIDKENSKRFLLPIRVQVNTDVETNGITFANYQLRLTAELRKGDTILDYPVNKVERGEEICHDYVTYTITRLLTSGYWSNAG